MSSYYLYTQPLFFGIILQSMPRPLYNPIRDTINITAKAFCTVPELNSPLKLRPRLIPTLTQPPS